MDSVQSLSLLVLLAPLVAAGAVALSALFQAQRLARLIAMGGAAISFVAASAALVRLWNGGSDGEATLNLGVWLSSGARDPFQLAFPIAVDVPAALLAAVTSLCTLCALAATAHSIVGRCVGAIGFDRCLVALVIVPRHRAFGKRR